MYVWMLLVSFFTQTNLTGMQIIAQIHVLSYVNHVPERQVRRTCGDPFTSVLCVLLWNRCYQENLSKLL